MLKRECQIVRGTDGTTRFGMCTHCKRHFLPAGEIWGRVEDFLRRKFDEHKCERITTQSDNSTKHVTIVKSRLRR